MVNVDVILQRFAQALNIPNAQSYGFERRDELLILINQQNPAYYQIANEVVWADEALQNAINNRNLQTSDSARYSASKTAAERIHQDALVKLGLFCDRNHISKEGFTQ